MMRFTFFTSVFLVLLAASPNQADAQEGAPHFRACMVQPGARTESMGAESGGIYITAKGTLRVLLVFASFADDSLPHPYWPAHQAPPSMRQFIDPDTSTHFTSPFNLTEYFRLMSLGQFHLVGDVLWVESRHPRSDYANGSWGRANANLLVERIDSLVDFSNYDAWTNLGPYVNVNAPDGIVDMIVVVWKGDKNLFQFYGEASLGANLLPGTMLQVDGKKIGMGYPAYLQMPVGSGVTVVSPYTDGPLTTMHTIAHELGHWLLGRPHPYNNGLPDGKHDYWGIICDGQRSSSCVNSYEREQLGWIQIPDIESDSTYHLSDYLTTGAALKFHPSSGDPLEYFYFENHQRLLAFDDVSSNAADKGLWVLHQQGPYMELDNLRIEPSDGRWSWHNLRSSPACSSQSFPVYARAEPQVANGLSHRDMLPNGSTNIEWMNIFEDQTGYAHCGSFSKGEYFTGAFDTSSAFVFSACSNPSTATWGGSQSGFALAVVGDAHGLVSVHSFINALVVPPARRFLGHDPGNILWHPDSLALAWGTQWIGGQQVEKDIVESELRRWIGGDTNGATVYKGPALSWTETGLVFDTTGTLPVRYKVRVRDAQGNYSAWSNDYTVKLSPVVRVEEAVHRMPSLFTLLGNYPNPFNPSTEIRYLVSVMSDVKLVVYDLLGREVAVLVDEVKAPGEYAVRFSAKVGSFLRYEPGRHTGSDGSELASGVYFYRLTAGSFVDTKRMMLIK